MQNNFKPCLAFVRHWEGGNDDDPDDPGGRTSRGIEQREYDAWCELHKIPGGDVWKAPDATVDEIYLRSYWLPYCEVLPGGLDLVFFDVHVNEGQHEAVLFLQRALGVAVDGHFGIVTMAAVKRACVTSADTKKLIVQMTVQRDAEYRSLRKFKKYGRGWLDRSKDCCEKAQGMAL